MYLLHINTNKAPIKPCTPFPQPSKLKKTPDDVLMYSSYLDETVRQQPSFQLGFAEINIGEQYYA
jgi:hypothetical protein